jgi:hypothetical protein
VVGSSPVLDPATAEALRLSALLEVVVRAVELQDRADEVIVACAEPGETPCAVARRGRVVAGEYGRMSGWADDLTAGDAVDSLPCRITGLVRYHLEMVDVALKLAFPRYRSERLERRRLALDGLGEPGWALRHAEAALRTRIDELHGA